MNESWKNFELEFFRLNIKVSIRDFQKVRFFTNLIFDWSWSILRIRLEKKTKKKNFLQAHSSVEKGVMLAAVRLRKLKTVRGGPFDNFCVTPEVLQAAIKVKFDEKAITIWKNEVPPHLSICQTSSWPQDPKRKQNPSDEARCSSCWQLVEVAYHRVVPMGKKRPFGPSLRK